MCCISRQATNLLFKYYISKLGGGVKVCVDNADARGGIGGSEIWENLLV